MVGKLSLKLKDNRYSIVASMIINESEYIQLQGSY